MIKKIVKKYFDVVPLFRYKEIGLRERLVLIFYVTGFFMAIVAFITTLFIGMPFLLNLPNLVVMIFCILLPFVFPKNFVEIALNFLYFVALIYLPIIYFINGGHDGVGVFYFLMMVVYFSFFLRGKKLVYTLIFVLSYYVSLILLGFFYPSLIIHYHDETARLIDIVVSLVVISVILSVIGHAVFRSYRIERKHVYELMNDLEDRNQELETLSHIDQLTTVYNRRYYMEALQVEFDYFEKTKVHFYVMMIDLDDFKCINDTHGHLYGDEILKNVASAIKSCLRDHDVVARYGGEEFSIIISHSTEESGLKIAERIRIAVDNINYRNESSITVSVGVVKNNENDTLLGILKRADEFLYVAKDKGKNRVEGD